MYFTDFLGQMDGLGITFRARGEDVNVSNLQITC